jgi:molybdenum cofactor cytidylyltransferase
MSSVWAIILAAGESKRMGFPKMLLPFNGLTMIENVIANVKSSDIDNTIVVSGSDRELLTEVIRKYEVIDCYNSNYKDGMLSSVKCGFRSLPSAFDAVLVFQGDQPLITPLAINTVIKAYKKSKAGIVIPLFENKRGHPLLISRKYREEIEKLCDSEGLRSLALKFAYDVLEVETDEPGILRDFDSYEEYMKEINQIN